jgi:hypothetical protein
MTQTQWMNRTEEHGSGTPILLEDVKSIGEVIGKLRDLEYVYSYEYDSNPQAYSILIEPSEDKYHNTPVGNWSNEFYTVREIMDLLYGAYGESFSTEVRDSEGKMIVTFKDTDEVNWNLFAEVVNNMAINTKAENEILKIILANKYIVAKAFHSIADFYGV